MCTIIVCNSFIANKVPRKDSFGIKLAECPYVEEFFNGRRYFPLYPLVSAYGPHLIDNFPETFYEGCHGFESVLHTELRAHLELFIKSVLS